MTDKRPLLAFLKVQEDAEREILYQLKRAAAQAARDIKRLTGGNFSQQIRAEQMKLVRQALLEQQAEIWESVGNTVQAGRVRAAAAAIETNGLYDKMLLEAVLDKDSVAVLTDAAKITAQRGVELITVREMGFSRYPLSEQVYKTRALSEGMIDRKVQSALARGLSAREFADEIVDFIRPDTPGGVRYAAMRLARTELNNAFHAVAVKDAQEKPWVATMKWNLSGSHPVPDECNDYAEDVHFKDGEPGQFKKEQVPAKPHPNCLCYITPEVMDTEAFIEGYFNGDFDKHIDDVMRKAGYPTRADGRLIGPIGGASGSGFNVANGQILAARRAALGLSRPQVVSRMSGSDMTVAKLARIEMKGGTDDEIRAVARALDVPEDRLLPATTPSPVVVAPRPAPAPAPTPTPTTPTPAAPAAPKPLNVDKVKIDKKNEHVVNGWPVKDVDGNIVGYVKKVETRSPNYVPGTRYASGFTKSTTYEARDAAGNRIGFGGRRNQSAALDDLKASLRKQAETSPTPRAVPPPPARTIVQPAPRPTPAPAPTPPPPAPTTTAPGLRAQREALNLSRTDISNRSGLSVAKVARIETKGGTPDELAAYQRALGTPGPPPATTVVAKPPPASGEAARPTTGRRERLTEWTRADVEKWQEHAKRMRAAEAGGDSWLDGLYELQGYHRRPVVYSNEDFDKLTETWVLLHRGVQNARSWSTRNKQRPKTATQIIEEFTEGDRHYPGLGIYGNGTYTSIDVRTAMTYGGDGTGDFVTMALRPTARVIKQEEAREKMQAEEQVLRRKRTAARQRGDEAEAEYYEYLMDLCADEGHWATARGYDAIRVPNAGGYGRREDYYVILNRAAVVIRRTHLVTHVNVRRARDGEPLQRFGTRR